MSLMKGGDFENERCAALFSEVMSGGYLSAPAGLNMR